MRWSLAAKLIGDASDGSDIVIVESLMGLFDGVSRRGHWGNGASSDLAAATGWPVLLLIDASGQSQTAAAGVRGFLDFREGVQIAGVVLNRVGSERHIRLASEALNAAGVAVVGSLPRTANVILPERHLGLVQAEETSELDERLDRLADFIETNIDVERVLQLARAGTLASSEVADVRPPGQRIALARDEAFSFVYPHLLKAWRTAGAEIVPFSPLGDEAPDRDADVVWLPGGYPELHASRLANARRFKSALKEFAGSRPVHGECGGYMALGTALLDANGERHEMADLLGLETSFAQKKLNLGYRRAEVYAPCVLGKPGDVLTGHEFHYATVLSSPDEPLFKVNDSDGRPLDRAGGSRRGLVTGSFFHLIDFPSH
jgi:cobyrinic acid a,c-diamide synthase